MENYCPTCDQELTHVKASAIGEPYYYCNNCKDCFVSRLQKADSIVQQRFEGTHEEKMRGLRVLGRFQYLKDQLTPKKMVQLGWISDKDGKERDGEFCPYCASQDIEMCGDPEYNDLWVCNDCGEEFSNWASKPNKPLSQQR